jgi:CubicO group peptidase (beta-lactamase class C family)
MRVVATVLALLASPLVAASPAPSHDDDAWARDVYAKRFALYQQGEAGAGLSMYDELAPLNGAAHWQPLTVKQVSHDRDGQLALALADTRAYAAANASTAFMVWHNGQLIEQSYWRGASQSSQIISKSLAKPLAVIAVGRAMALGYISSLDQPAAHWLKSWRGTPKADITLRQILGMRSGLLPQAGAADPAHVLNRAYLHPYHDRVLLQDYPLVAPPGSRYEYSNANGDLVALIIERATGQSYQKFLGQEVLAKIGAHGGQIWLDRPGGVPHSGCCALLPAETYLRLGILLAQGGVWQGRRLLSRQFLADMTKGSPQNPHAGLGVYLGKPYAERRGAANPDQKAGATFHSEPYAANDLFLFDGNANQVVYIIPSARLVILRCGDRPPPRPEWDNAYLPNRILRAVQTAGPDFSHRGAMQSPPLENQTQK